MTPGHPNTMAGQQPLEGSPPAFSAIVAANREGSDWNEAMNTVPDVPSDDDIDAIGRWIESADAWANAAQTLVGMATDFAVVSLDTATALGGRPWAGPETETDLTRLADELERDTSDLRNRYLATAADISLYREVMRGREN